MNQVVAKQAASVVEKLDERVSEFTVAATLKEAATAWLEQNKNDIAARAAALSTPQKTP